MNACSSEGVSCATGQEETLAGLSGEEMGEEARL
jgi:hypothetical protein